MAWDRDRPGRIDRRRQLLSKERIAAREPEDRVNRPFSQRRIRHLLRDDPGGLAVEWGQRDLARDQALLKQARARPIERRDPGPIAKRHHNQEPLIARGPREVVHELQRRLIRSVKVIEQQNRAALPGRPREHRATLEKILCRSALGSGSVGCAGDAAVTRASSA